MHVSMTRTALFLLAAAGMLAATAGCGGGEFSHNDAVDGTVTLDGAPVGGVAVEFVPLAIPHGQVPPRSQGVTDETGHFTLTRADGKPGAVVGQHRVMIRPVPGNGEAAAQVPGVYQIDGQTPLYVEVTPDQHTVDLKLFRDAKPSHARDPLD